MAQPLTRLARNLEPWCTLAPGGPTSATEGGGLTSEQATEVLLQRACFDSRRVQRGDLYCAIPGVHVDGALFLNEAIARGAGAVLHRGRVACSVAQLKVDLGIDVASAAGHAAAQLAGRPGAEMMVAAVTGTNGKTTVVHLLEQAWNACGVPAARVGTLGYAFAGDTQTSLNTTPPADLLHAWLGEQRRRGARALALEASSHGIHQQRLAGLDVDLVGWTNLSHDHLDYHGDLDHYAAAKARLVHELPADGLALLPQGDARIDAACEGSRCTSLRWGLAVSTDAGASWRGAVPALHGTLLGEHAAGLSLEIDGVYGQARIDSGLVGRHNAENLLLAFSLLRASGIDGADAARALAAAGAAPGRLERVPSAQPWSLYVDYAHTPEALERALAALRKAHPQARLGIVCGAGGDRDADKRGPMGFQSARGADWCMLTSDNPRSEDPDLILQQVHDGAQAAQAAGNCAAEILIEADRRQAIRRAVARLQPGDVLLVAGKGHEDYQEIHGQRLPFDDRQELTEAVQCLG